MSEWKETTLGELIDIKHGYAFKGEFFSETPTENVLLTPGNFHIGGGFKGDKFKYYTGDIPDEYVLSPGDIIVTMTDLSKAGDTLGYSAKIPASRNLFLHNQRLGLVTIKSSEADINFIYWLLRTHNYQKTVVNSCSGSTVKHTSPSKIKDYVFLLPPLEEQKSIDAVLSCLDRKIENLRKQNETLEAIAQTLFKHWFVDFEFPNADGKPYKSSGGAMEPSELGDIPAGWRVGKLGDLFNLNYGKSLTLETRIPGQYAVVGSSGVVGSHQDYLVKAPGIVIGRKGTIGQVIWLEENFYPIDTTFYVEDVLGCSGLYFYYFLLKRQDFQRLTSDSAVPGLNRDMAYSVEVAIPEISFIDKFNEFSRGIFNKADLNHREIQTLTQARNVLLPKLMSGKLCITT